jgi:hypothetical protein
MIPDKIPPIDIGIIRVVNVEKSIYYENKFW